MSTSEAKQAAEKVLALNPIPSCSFSNSEPVVYIAPDAIFSVEQGKLVIELNEYILLHLSINAEYSALLTASNEPEVHGYMREKAVEAHTLIKGVHMRCDTLWQLLTTFIAAEQHSFFCGGGMLTPITMQQLAEKMRVSTFTMS